jgi:hypothetical protein
MVHDKIKINFYLSSENADRERERERGKEIDFVFLFSPADVRSRNVLFFPCR